jgi:phage terminase large subunit-like protein
MARPDWRERIRAGRSLMPDLPELDRKRAGRAIAVYNRLRVPDVPGQPTFGEAGGEWFREIVGAMHGSIDAAGKRQIESFLCLVPKKNTKTTSGAALMLTELLLNERPRERFTLIGPTQKIAETGYSQVEGFLEADAALKNRFQVQTHLKRVTYLPTKSRLEVKSFDPKIVTGINGSALVDELHLLGEIANADRVIGQLRGGLIARPGAFLGFITTQSERPPAGVFAAELKKARAIRDGKATGTMLPILYEFPEEYVAPVRTGETPRWHDTSIWPWVTPNNGRSITVERLAADFQEAKLAGEEEVRRWASQHLNIEIGQALLSDRWSGADHFEAAATGPKALAELIAASEVVVAGIDGGGLDDLLALCVIGRDKLTKRWLVWVRAWCHESVLELRKSEAPRLRDFEAAGDLRVCKEFGEDIVELADLVEWLAKTGKLADKHALGVDQAGIGQIVDEIGGRGIDTSPEAQVLVGISQGWSLTGPIQTAGRKLADGTMIHGGQKLLAWAVGNCRREPRGNAILITKQASGTAKIDPAMAMFDAVALMSRNPPAPGSVYEERGLIFVS